MLRSTRSRFLTAGAAGVAAALLPMTAFAGSPGTGTVTTVVAATTIPGALTLTGTGVSVTPSQAPGAFGSSIGATALTVTDLTGTTNGWAVTATYADPSAALQAAGQKPLGAANVEVSSSGISGDAAAAVQPVTDAPLSTPVTVLTTATSSGAGVTVGTTSLKVRIPTTAQVGEVYGGTVTYTVASVR